MNKLMQIVSVIGCWFEIEQFTGTKKVGLRRIVGAVGSVKSGIPFLLILVVGILMGWVRIPTYMGDGHSYDNFFQDTLNLFGL